MTNQPDATTPEVGGVAKRAQTALGWSLLNTAIGRLGTLAINVALARVLGPSEFGTFAVAMLAVLAVLSLNELGVSLAIVRWEADPGGIVPTVTTIAVGMSAILAALMILVAPAFAGAMGALQATPVVQVMALAVLIDGFASSSAALLQREFRQRRRFAIDQANTWLGAVVSLGLAMTGLGAMSLAVGRVVGSAVSAVMMIRAAGFALGFDRDVARGLLGFGLPLAGSSAVLFFAGYADQLVVGRTLGPEILAFYVLAFNLSSWPVSVLSQPLRNVAPAAFARIQSDPKRMNRVFTRVVGVLASVTVPACVALSAAALPLVLVVYGSAWVEAATALRWLALAAIWRILFELSYDFLVVIRASTAVLFAQVTWVVVLVPALIVAANRGLLGVSVAQFAVTAGVMGPVYLSILRRRGVSLRSLAGVTWLPSLVGGCLWLVCHEISAQVASPWWALAGTALSSAVALAVLVRRQWPQISDLRAGTFGR